MEISSNFWPWVAVQLFKFLYLIAYYPLGVLHLAEAETLKLYQVLLKVTKSYCSFLKLTFSECIIYN